MGCFGLRNKVGLYEKLVLIGSQHYSSVFPLNSIDVSFTLRNSEDPMFIAKSLSNSSFDFGLSSHDLAALGFLGLIISLLLICRPCIVVCSIRRIPKYQDLEKMREGEISDPELESVIRRRRRFANPDDDTTMINESGIARAVELSRLPLSSSRTGGDSCQTQAGFDSHR